MKRSSLARPGLRCLALAVVLLAQSLAGAQQIAPAVAPAVAIEDKPVLLPGADDHPGEPASAYQGPDSTRLAYLPSGVDWASLLKRLSPLLAGPQLALVGDPGFGVGRVALPDRTLVHLALFPLETRPVASLRARGWFAVGMPRRGYRIGLATPVRRPASPGRASRGHPEPLIVLHPGALEALAWAPIEQGPLAGQDARAWRIAPVATRGPRIGMVGPVGRTVAPLMDEPTEKLQQATPIGQRAQPVQPGKQFKSSVPKRLLVQAQPQPAQPGAPAPAQPAAVGQPAAAVQPGAEVQPGAGEQPPAAAAVPLTGAAIAMPLAPGDVVALTVLDEPTLTGQFMLREDGRLNLPMLGMVQAAGLTPTQLADQLTTLCEKYIIKPVVSVTPVSVSPRVISIFGQVARPGTYDLRQCPTLLSLLATAGGDLPTGNLAEAVLVRGQETVKIIPEGAEGLLPRDMLLEPGDAVYVPPRMAPVVHVMGAVIGPGVQSLQAAQTASKAVILAGGPAPTADLRHGYILRGQDRVDVNLEPFLGGGQTPTGAAAAEAKDLALEPGDVVVIPQKIQKHVYVVGSVTSPGPQPIEEASLVSQAIAMAGGLAETADKANGYLLRGGEKIPLDLEGLFEKGKAEADLALQAGDAIVVPLELPIFHIVGQVQKPGVYQLNQARSVLDAWSLAGGELEDANLRQSVLLREGEEPRTIDIDALVNRGDMSQNVDLKAGDKLVVPKALEYVYVLGQVLKPGPQALQPGDSLMELMGRAGGPTAIADVKGIVLVHKEELLAAQAQVAAAAAGEGGERPRPARRRSETAKPGEVTAEQPPEGQKVTLMDLAKVQAGEVQYVARAGDVVYVPALRERREWIYSVIGSLLTALLVRD